MTATVIETLNGRNRDFASHRHVSSLEMCLLIWPDCPRAILRVRRLRLAPAVLGRYTRGARSLGDGPIALGQRRAAARHRVAWKDRAHGHLEAAGAGAAARQAAQCRR